MALKKESENDKYEAIAMKQTVVSVKLRCGGSITATVYNKKIVFKLPGTDVNIGGEDYFDEISITSDKPTVYGIEAVIDKLIQVMEEESCEPSDVR